MLPKNVILLSKIFLPPKSIKNLPIPTATQIHGWNIAKAAMIVTQIGKMFGVMKQNVDDVQWVQFMVTSYLGGNYLY